jgi:hypothetical protein
MHVEPTVFLLEYVPIHYALTHQARKFEECKIHLEENLEILSRFFHQWRSRLNPSKTEVCVFHLPTESLTTLYTHVDYPKYLGMTLDRTLTYKSHLGKTGIICQNSLNPAHHHKIKGKIQNTYKLL